MKLDDPKRPRMGERACWLSQKGVIAPLDVMPVDNEQSQVSIMLPVVDVGRKVGFIWFRTNIKNTLIPDLMSEFYDDPENTLLVLYNLSGYMKPFLLPLKEPTPVSKPERIRL